MPDVHAPAVLVLGAGRAGLAVGAALEAAGRPVHVWSRSADGDARTVARGLVPADGTTVAPLWLLAVPDDALAPLAAELAATFAGGPATARALPRTPPQVALHLSGATGVEALAPLRAVGVAIGGLHPLQTLTPASPPGVLRGAPAAVGGDAPAVAAAQALARATGLRPFAIAEADRAHYHAAGALAANFTVTLLDAAIAMATRAGMPEALAREGLAALAAAAADRVRAEGPAAALTGPIRRGDAGVVAAHLAALGADADAPPGTAALYRTLARQTLALAERAGLDAAGAAAVRAALERPAHDPPTAPH